MVNFVCMNSGIQTKRPFEYSPIYTLFKLYVAFISMLYIINGILFIFLQKEKNLIIYDQVNNVHASMIPKKVYRKHPKYFITEVNSLAYNFP